MSNEVFRTFQAMSDQRPPPSRRMYQNVPLFRSATHAQSEINALEKLMGLPPGEKVFHIRQLNDRVTELRSLLEQSNSAAATPADISRAEADKVLEEYNSILHPSDRTEYYRKNKALMDRAWRDAPAGKQGHSKVTGSPVIDQLNSIEDPLSRTAHYRKNKEAIDAAYRNLP